MAQGPPYRDAQRREQGNEAVELALGRLDR
jgi:hypothetical protein